MHSFSFGTKTMTELYRQITANMDPAVYELMIIWIGFMLLAAYAGSRKDRLITGAVLGLLLGPVGIVYSLIMHYGGDITCPNCGKRTWWVPKQPGTGPPHTSTPHLRCIRCGKIIWNEDEVRFGSFSPPLSERFGDFIYSIHKKIKDRKC